MSRPETGRPLQRAHFQRQAEQADKAFGIALVVDVLLPKGGEILAVQAEGALAPGRDDIAFVQLEAHRAGDRPLGAVHKGIQRLAQRGEPQPIVDQLGIFERHHVS